MPRYRSTVRTRFPAPGIEKGKLRLPFFLSALVAARWTKAGACCGMLGSCLNQTHDSLADVASVVKLVDTSDLKSAAFNRAYRFDSGPRHQQPKTCHVHAWQVFLYLRLQKIRKISRQSALYLHKKLFFQEWMRHGGGTGHPVAPLCTATASLMRRCCMAAAPPACILSVPCVAGGGHRRGA